MVLLKSFSILLGCLVLVESYMNCFCILSLVGFYSTFLSNLLCSSWTVSVVEFGGVCHMWLCVSRAPGSV